MTELRYDTVTLLTDYGLADGWVGVMHSVIRQLSPGVGIVDLAHQIAPFDVRGGSLLLARSVQYLCPGVIVAVVDPGVGTQRRAIAVEVAGGAAVLVGPDNGLLAPAVGMLGGAERAVVLDRTDFHLPTASTTFDGRDVFAPVAAHLCRGVPLDEVGTPVDSATLLPGVVPLSRDEGGAIVAEVIWVDRFGNVQLNVQPDEIEGWDTRVVADLGRTRRRLRRVSAFAQVPTGDLGVLIDASGMLAIVADRSSAAEELGLGIGDAITLSPSGDEDSAPVTSSVTSSVSLGRRPT
ncbi:MAG: SAM-dependent chlorinase/fluorinase [Actinobacteria bacterium]|nr:SAM-dependent chlorinase/fluorinase [Actinomycetota bacterium]